MSFRQWVPRRHSGKEDAEGPHHAVRNNAAVIRQSVRRPSQEILKRLRGRKDALLVLSFFLTNPAKQEEQGLRHLDRLCKMAGEKAGQGKEERKEGTARSPGTEGKN